jgi:hypothetical protein
MASALPVPPAPKALVAGNASDLSEVTAPLQSAWPVSCAPVERRPAHTCFSTYGCPSSSNNARNKAALFSNDIASARTVGFTPAFASAAFNTPGA